MLRKFRVNLFFFIVLMIVLNSCKATGPNRLDADKSIVYPLPPDTARIQFLTSINSSLDIDKSYRSSFINFVTGEKNEIKPIVKPYGVAVKYGKIYISDIGLAAIDIIDLENKKFDYLKPSGYDQFKIPASCFVDRRGYIFVPDSYREKVFVFDNNKNKISEFGLDENFKPVDVHVNDDKIYVANIIDHRINVFRNDTSYKFINSFPEVEPEDDAFLRQPKSITVRNDKVYVSDFGDFNVKVFSIEGKYLNSVGSQGTMPGQFARQKGIDVDRDGNLYVVDAVHGNAQIFDDKERLLLFFAGTRKYKKGNLYLPADICIDYDNLKYFENFVHPDYKLKYLIFITNQYGSNKLNVYGRIEPK